MYTLYVVDGDLIVPVGKFPTVGHAEAYASAEFENRRAVIVGAHERIQFEC